MGCATRGELVVSQQITLDPPLRIGPWPFYVQHIRKKPIPHTEQKDNLQVSLKLRPFHYEK